MLSQHATHFTIYSHGRTGSMLLARNLGATLGTLNDPVPVRHVTYNAQYTQQVNNTLESDVLQTHIMHLGHDKKYTRVFSVREEHDENILSFILAQHYKSFHVAPVDPEPFYCNSNMVDQLCRSSIQWHRWYALQLEPTDLVVVYEKMMQKISTEPNRRVFKNKKNLILNFDEVVDVVRRNSNLMVDSLQPFIQHQNPWNIYESINHSIQF